MDFDFKIYIPLIAAFVTACVALLLGIINARINIKIKNNEFLIDCLQKDITQLMEVQNYIIEILPRLFDLTDCIESNSMTVDEYKEITNSKLLINNKIISIYSILEESSQSEELLNIVSYLAESNFSTLDLEIVNNFLKALELFLSLLANELTIKRNNLKNSLL